MEVRALAKHQRVAPRKVRQVLDLIKGRRVDEALALLDLMPQRSARIVSKVVRSAAANGENNYGLDPDSLIIKSATAGDARRAKSLDRRSRGRWSMQIRRFSHIEIVVGDDDG